MKSLAKKIYTNIALKAHEIGSLPSQAHTFVLTMALLVAVAATDANAAGFASFFSGWKDAGKALLDLLFFIGVIAGAGAVLYGLINLVKKGLDGERTDITWGKIGWPIVGGGLLSIMLYVLQTTVETGGASRGDIGKGL